MTSFTSVCAREGGRRAVPRLTKNSILYHVASPDMHMDVELDRYPAQKGIFGHLYTAISKYLLMFTV